MQQKWQRRNCSGEVRFTRHYKLSALSKRSVFDSIKIIHPTSYYSAADSFLDPSKTFTFYRKNDWKETIATFSITSLVLFTVAVLIGLELLLSPNAPSPALFLVDNEIEALGDILSSALSPRYILTRTAKRRADLLRLEYQ